MSGDRSQRGLWGGRSNRKQYWLLVLLVFALVTALSFLPGTNGASTASIIVWTMVYARRLHDIGRSGWWGVLALVASCVPLIAAFVFGGDAFVAQLTDRQTSDQGELWYAVAVFGALLAQFIFTLWLGLQKGEPSENRFGPPPGRRPAAAS